MANAPNEAIFTEAIDDVEAVADGDEKRQDIIFEDLVGQLVNDVRDAVDFIEEFAQERERAQEYYNGNSSVPVDGNRSKYVATVTRDKIRGMRPSLLRIFLGTVSPVAYLASAGTPPALANQQTKYVQQMFEASNGYMVLYEAFQTAMLQKIGPVQYWWQDDTQYDYRTYTNLTETQVLGMEADPNVDVTSLEEVDGALGMDGKPLYSAECRYSKPAGCLKVQAFPVGEFIFSDEATNTEEPRVIGRQKSISISDALEMYPDLEFDQLADLDDYEVETSDYQGEAEARRGYIRDYGSSIATSGADPTMRRILITDVFYRADLDNTGIAQCYRWILGGTGYELLHYERSEDGPNFVCFEVDPEPQTLQGKSMYDLTHNDQDGLTFLTRTILNNAAETNHPRLGVHETLVNMDDVLNKNIGHPIRFRAPGQIQPISVPFVAGQTMPMLDYWQRDIEAKTGVTRASLGLDPDALQSTDKEAVKNTINQAAGQIEVYARNLAETGMVPLFRGILRLCMRHQDPQQVMWITGDQYVPVDLRQFDPTLNTVVNVGLGNGNDEQRVAALSTALGLQQQIIQQFGLQQPIVTPQHLTNTIEDLLKAMGLKDTSRYFGQLNEQQSQMLTQMASQQAQQQKAEAQQAQQAQLQVLTDAERIRANSKMLVAAGQAKLDAREKAVDTEVTIAQDRMQDDLKRDQMFQDLVLEAARLVAQYNSEKVDTEAVVARQDETP